MMLGILYGKTTLCRNWFQVQFIGLNQDAGGNTGAGFQLPNHLL